MAVVKKKKRFKIPRIIFAKGSSLRSGITEPELRRSSGKLIAALRENWPAFGLALFITILVSWLVLIRITTEKEEMSPSQPIKTTHEAPAVGREAPDFTLESTDGQKLTFSDFSGKRGALVVLLATWHPFGQDALKILETLHKKQRSWVLIPIAVQEEKKTVSDFLKRGGYNLSVYLDISGEVGEKYQVTALPSFYFIDKKGVFNEVYVGPLSREEILEKGREL